MSSCVSQCSMHHVGRVRCDAMRSFAVQGCGSSGRLAAHRVRWVWRSRASLVYVGSDEWFGGVDMDQKLRVRGLDIAAQAQTPFDGLIDGELPDELLEIVHAFGDALYICFAEQVQGVGE